jgi:hypothetical protein
MRYDIRLGWWKDGMELLANRWCEAEGEEGKGEKERRGDGRDGARSVW